MGTLKISHRPVRWRLLESTGILHLALPGGGDMLCSLAILDSFLSLVTHGTSEKRFIWLTLPGHKQNLKAGFTATLHSIVSRQGAHSQPRTYNRNHPETTACWLTLRLMLRLVPYEVCCPGPLLPQWAEPSCID